MFDTVEDRSSTIKNIQCNLEEKKNILERLKGKRGKNFRLSQGVVWVTDLLNPRRTYFKEKFPEVELEIPLEQRELMWAGSDFHNVFGRAVYPEAYQERYINKGGIAGRIDLFKDFPIEVKRTTTPIKEDILASRPENVEQLGMYSAMVGVDRGHLIYYVCNSDSDSSSNGGEIRAYEIVFKDLTAILNEMKVRRELLLDAWNRNDPSRLPPCKWQGRGCECERAKKCDCASKENENGFKYNIVEQVSELTLIPGEGERLSRVMSGYLNRPRLGGGIGFWDILYPRKYYFKAVEPGSTSNQSKLRGKSGKDLAWVNERRGIENAIKHGAKSDFEIVYSKISDERLSVLNYKGKPAIISQPGLRSPLLPDKNAVSKFLGDYVEILGMECVLTGLDSGWLIAYYPNVPDGDSRLVVYYITFTGDGLAGYNKLMEERLNVMRLAAESGDLSILPFCPEFKCKYKDWACPNLGRCKSPEL
jgi:hypothetical protein